MRFGGGTGRNGSPAEGVAGRVRSHALTTGIGAALLLYFGFAAGLSGVSGSAWYDGSVAAFTWTLKTGGVMLGAAALACLSGMPWGLLFDGMVSVGVGVVFFGAATIWTVYGDFQGLLILILAVMFLHAGWSQIAEYIQLRAASTDEADEAKHRTPTSWEERISRWASAKRTTNEGQARQANAGVMPGLPEGGPQEEEQEEHHPQSSGTRSTPHEEVPMSRSESEEQRANAGGTPVPPEGFLAALAKEREAKRTGSQ